MTPEERLEAIREIYDTLPNVECKGKCASHCAGVDMSNLERETIERRHQLKIRPQEEWEILKNGPKKCRALNKHGMCRVYEDRPLICRAFGAIEAAPCPYGCKADRYLTDEEYKRIQIKVELLGGHWSRSEMQNVMALGMLNTEAGKKALKKSMDAAREEVAKCPPS